MSSQDLRTASGQLIGRVVNLSSGKQEIRSPSGQLKGTYDPRTNETRDPSGRLVGKGNLMSSLL